MTSAIRLALVGVAAATVLLPVPASAQFKNQGYLTDNTGAVVKSVGANVCVRTSDWTPARAIIECDPDLVPKPAPKAPPPPPAKKPEAKKPEAKKAAPAGEFVVQVGAFANPESAIAKLSTAGVPHYTEAAGSLTRVLAGPFASREAAERALKQLRSLGLTSGKVIAKAG